MGAVNTTYTFTATDTITSTKMNNIIDETVMTGDAVLGGSGGSGGLDIASGKLSISANAINSSRLATNSVTSSNIVDGTIVNADINASAAIAGTKIAPSFGGQEIQQNGANARILQYNASSGAVTDFGIGTLTGFQDSIGLNVANSTGVLSLGTNSAERMRITASGNVGVGTTSPSYKLDVNGDIKSRSGWFLGSRGTSGFTGLSTAENTSSGGCIIVRDDNSTFNPHGVEFYANSTERMRIQSNGNVGIGKTNPSTILDVNGTVTATAFSGPLTGNVTGNASSASTVSNSAITAAKLDGNQSGSAPIYGCRAWVSFAGRSTNGDCTIRSAGTGNVYRVARTAEGRYTVYFTTAMQDENYATITGSDANSPHKIAGVISQSAGEVNIAYSQVNTSTERIDPTWGQVSIFR
jgi:hypothetical protein